jgi:hypothetical protein
VQEETSVAVPAAVPETKTDEDAPPGPSTLNAAVEPDADEDDEDEDADAAFEPEYDPDADNLFPATHELVLKDHTKVISALALDPSGARVLSGSHDYDCKLWDFGGMDARCRPFKTWEPAGTYYVRVSCSWSASLG